MGTGMIAACAVLALVVLLAMWVAGTYNGLVRLRNFKEEGWSGIDVQLKRRHDLVGNLVNSVKAYMTHEKETLENVIKARAMASGATSVAEAAQYEGGLSQMLGKLFAVMENYPQLKANENVMHLQQELVTLENDIQMARRYYNGTVRELNVKVESFPSNIIAGMFHFTKADFFELDNAAERQAPTVQF